MIKITDWTRQATAYKIISDADACTHEQDNTEKGTRQLALRIRHDGGRYIIAWTLEINQGMSTLSYPMSDYNGKYTYKTARFSKKYLENVDSIICAQIDKYFELWNAGNYYTMILEILSDIGETEAHDALSAQLDR